jgi:hypothetical protein
VNVTDQFTSLFSEKAHPDMHFVTISFQKSRNSAHEINIRHYYLWLNSCAPNSRAPVKREQDGCMRVDES